MHAGGPARFGKICNPAHQSHGHFVIILRAARHLRSKPVSNICSELDHMDSWTGVFEWTSVLFAHHAQQQLSVSPGEALQFICPNLKPAEKSNANQAQIEGSPPSCRTTTSTIEARASPLTQVYFISSSGCSMSFDFDLFCNSFSDQFETRGNPLPSLPATHSLKLK